MFMDTFPWEKERFQNVSGIKRNWISVVRFYEKASITYKQTSRGWILNEQ